MAWGPCCGRTERQNSQNATDECLLKHTRSAFNDTPTYRIAIDTDGRSKERSQVPVIGPDARTHCR